MKNYVIKRLIMLIPVIFGVSFLVFVMMDMAPGTVLDIIGEEMSEEALRELYYEYGYDRSVFYRYFIYIKDLLQGDLGYSYIYNMDVWDLYMQRLPSTIKLAGASILVCVVLSIPLGIKSATSRGSLMDNFCSVLSILGLSIPNFWLGMLLVIWFSVGLGWFPVYGDEMGWRSLVLPAITVGTGLMAVLTRTTRSSMLDVLSQDYLRTARAKGIPESQVVNHHGLRNALIPIITIIGTQLGACLGGAVVTENVFQWPGVGRLLIDSIKQRDTMTVTGCLIITVLLICLVQLLVDILYACVDPRLRSQYASDRKKKTPKTPEKEGT